MAAAAAAATMAVRKAKAAEIRKGKRNAFDKFDDDKSGGLSFGELPAALKQLKIDASPAEVQALVEKYGKGHSELSFAIFDKMVEDLLNEPTAKPVPGAPKVPQGSMLGADKHLPYQEQCWDLYNYQPVVMLVAGFILGNFIVNIVEKEIDPDINNLKYSSTWDNLDLFFNIVFIIELLMNMYGYGGPVRKFWASPWNCFDFFIVSVSVILLAGVIPPDNPASKLKLLRAFRVFRLFKRIKSLNKIIVALVRSIPGVVNAFIIMFIFFCIYAILAVELFRDFGSEVACPEDGSMTCYNTIGDDGDNYTVSAVTARGFTNGWEYYGTFSRALYTLFQVMTGESWSEAVARPLLFGLSPPSAVLPTAFFVSFIILTQMVLINVVVAVLLDKFVQDEDPPASDDEAPVDLPELEMPSETGKGAVGSMPLPPAQGSSPGTPTLTDVMAQIEALSRAVAQCNASLESLRHDKVTA